MGRRWSWDFEDDPPPAPAASPAGCAAAGAPARRGRSGGRLPTGREALVRRRRVVALRRPARAARDRGRRGLSRARTTTPAAATRVRKRRAASRPPTDPEQEEMQAVQSVLAYTPFVKEGSGNAREIALTFDDGPGPFTPQVLAVLERDHVPADVLRDRQDAALLRRLDRARDRRRRRDRRSHRGSPDARPPRARTTSTNSSSNRARASNCSADAARRCSVPPTARSTRPPSGSCSKLHHADGAVVGGHRRLRAARRRNDRPTDDGRRHSRARSS